MPRFCVVMTGGIIFWGNSTHSSKIFQIQKRAVRIIMGRRRSEFYRNLFKELNILPLKSQYILSLFFFVANNKSYFMTNSENFSMPTIHSNDLHLPQTKLVIFQKRSLFFRC
jgi:hypothetical protein